MLLWLLIEFNKHIYFPVQAPDNLTPQKRRLGSEGAYRLGSEGASPHPLLS